MSTVSVCTLIGAGIGIILVDRRAVLCQPAWLQICNSVLTSGECSEKLKCDDMEIISTELPDGSCWFPAEL